MKKNAFKLLALAFALVISTLASANTSQMSAPLYGKGKPVYNTTTIMGVQASSVIGISDSSLGLTVVATSASSTARNLTDTAGLSPSSTTAPYVGNFVVRVTNPNASCTMVFYASMTSTSITSSMPAGAVVKPLDGATIVVQSRDGITGHFQGLTGPCTVQYSVSNE